MRQKNDIEKIKEAIKQLIYRKCTFLWKYVFGCSDARYARAVATGNLRLFSIGVQEFRSVDRKCTIDGKRTWLSGIAIRELADEGSLIVSKSYCKSPQNPYCKGYALTLGKLRQVRAYIDVDVKFTNRKDEWDDTRDFADGFE